MLIVLFIGLGAHTDPPSVEEEEDDEDDEVCLTVKVHHDIPYQRSCELATGRRSDHPSRQFSLSVHMSCAGCIERFLLTGDIIVVLVLATIRQAGPLGMEEGLRAKSESEEGEVERGLPKLMRLMT